MATAEVGDDGTFHAAARARGRRPLPGGGRSRADPLDSDPGRRPAARSRSPLPTLRPRRPAASRSPGRSLPVERRRRAVLEVYDAGRKRWQRERTRRASTRSGAVTFRHRFEEPGGRRVRIALQRSALASGFARDVEPAGSRSGVPDRQVGISARSWPGLSSTPTTSGRRPRQSGRRSTASSAGRSPARRSCREPRRPTRRSRSPARGPTSASACT